MLIKCRFSIVGLHLLFLTHIAHSFVLLTANVEDVKKIARKFVSDTLAEKIADFIARVSAGMAQNADAPGSSEVSAENRMYNVEKRGGDSEAAEGKSKEDIVLGKVTVQVPRKTFESEEPGTTRRPKKVPKPLHGRSRYIVEPENRASLVTNKPLSKINEAETFNKIKESIQQIEDNLFSTPGGTTKNTKQKRKTKVRAYKLLSGFASVEKDATKSGIPDNKETKDDKVLFNFRTFDDEKEFSSPTEEAATGIEHDIENNKAEKAVAQQEIKDDKNTEIVHTNEPVKEKDEFENTIIQKTDKVAPSVSRSLAAETDGKEVNWWEKELPAHNHEGNTKGKSWF